MSHFSDIMSSSVFFWCCFLSLVKSSCWSKFHVNIITGSQIMTIFFCKGLTRNPEIRNNLVWILSNIWRLGQDSETKFGMNVSNKMLLNTGNCQCYSFHCFWVIKGKPTAEVKLDPPHTQIRVKGCNDFINTNICCVVCWWVCHESSDLSFVISRNLLPCYLK